MQAGLITTFQSGVRTRKTAAWILSGLLFLVYLMFYFNLPPGLDRVVAALGLGSRWTLYGTLYTIAIIIGGIYFLTRHGNSRYQRLRTISLIFFQVVFAFSIPMVMEIFGSKGFTFSIFWPLKIDYFYPSNIFQYPVLLIVYAFITALIGVPIMTFLYGKRWYCSWMCGCGGLAETAGEPFRHLSSKKSKAWRFEQISIHSVLVLALATTAIVIINWGLHYTNGNGEWVTDHAGFNFLAGKIQGVYQFLVVAVLSGVLGVGLYPVMGSRVWCRFFCPLAAILGLFQKFGRFRITVKKDMCISCGNCSTYCEMGIDVRAYAQTNQTFKRAACVGCGLCAHMCPRGVLKLENKFDFRPGPDRKVREIFDL